MCLRRRLLSDRRVIILTLTEQGTALTQDLQGRVQAYDARLCEGVSEEQMEAIVGVSAKVMASYDAMAQATRS